MQQFRNTAMKQAIKSLRQDENPITIQHMRDCLVVGQLLVPAQWDKDPVKDNHGQMVFSPDTKFQLMVIADDEGNYYFPMFTSMEELRKWDKDEEVQSLVMTFDQYLPFVKVAQNDIQGIVIDPYSENVPLSCEYIIDISEQKDSEFQARDIRADDEFDLREPVANVEAMISQLQYLGKRYPEIKAIYFKERLVKGKPSHWFVMVDMDPENPEIFRSMGTTCAPVAKGKGIEFMFASTPQGEKIAQENQPIYQEKTN